MTMYQSRLWTCLSFGALSAFGCGDAGASSGREPAAPGALTVSIADGTELRGASPSIAVSFGDRSSPMIEISIVAGSKTDTKWAALVHPGQDFLSSGRVSARVSAAELRDGEAAVQRSELKGDNVEFAPTGTLSLVVRGGVLEGNADGMSDRFEADFEGPVSIKCYVPSSAVGSGVAAPVVTGGAPSLVEDSALQSESCRGLTSGPLMVR